MPETAQPADAAAPVIVTAAPPTPNGDLHLGHLSGPYSGADVYARAARLLGRPARYLVGSDLHQSYLPAKARELGLDPVAMARMFDGEIEALFAAMGFMTAGYLRPAESALHTSLVRDFFATLWRNGRIVVKTAPGLLCPRCRVFLAEASVTGTCPHCGNDDCDGYLCEVCAWPNTGTDLIGPHCNQCGEAPVPRDCEQLVFPLPDWAGPLRAYHARVHMSPQLATLSRDLLAHGLPDVPVCVPSSWGLPVPVDGFGGHRLYVWAEMVPGYFAQYAESLAAEGRDPARWRDGWNAAEVAQFFGWDNSWFHALLFPALMMAWDGNLRLPHALLANEFLQLDGLKFSTSRQHAVWGSALAAVVPADTVRFALALDRPEFEATSFSFTRFRELVDGELVRQWQDWLSGLFGRLAGICANIVPDAGPAGYPPAFVASVHRLAADCLAAYTPAAFSVRLAARSLVELVGRTRDFAAAQSAHRSGPPDAAWRATVAAEAWAAKTLAQLAWPVMPRFAQELWSALGGAGAPRWDDLRPLEPGTVIVPPGLLFRPLPADLEARVLASAAVLPVAEA